MNGIRLAGFTCFLLVIILLVWCTLPSYGVTGDIEHKNETINENISSPNLTVETGEKMEAASTVSKGTTEDDLSIGIIKPTVAPATPHEDLTSSFIDTLTETLTTEVKIVLPKRSMLHGFDTTESISIHGSFKDVEKATVNDGVQSSKVQTQKISEENTRSKKVIEISEHSTISIAQTTLEEAREDNSSVKESEGLAETDRAVVNIESNVKETPTETGTKEVGDTTHENLETFAEWREKQGLKSQKILETTAKGKAKKTSTRKQVNYASADCGAKVVAANSEANNLAAMLSENKDIYMLSPCKSKIWFIIELCERIQVDSIEIANYELFSSTPNSFNVLVSSRHPSRDWQLLGLFHGRDERQLQHFPLEEKHYAKFIKVEMLSHFGNEHYCPVSLFRVFGTSEVDEFEDSENTDSDHDTSDSEVHDNVLPANPNLEKEKDKSPNFIESAKDAVLDMVSKAVETLTKKTGENSTQKVSLDIVKDTATKDTNGTTDGDKVSNETSMLEPIKNPNTIINDVNSSIVEPIKDEVDDENTDLYHKFSLYYCQGEKQGKWCISSLSKLGFHYGFVKRQCISKDLNLTKFNVIADTETVSKARVLPAVPLHLKDQIQQDSKSTERIPFSDSSVHKTPQDKVIHLATKSLEVKLPAVSVRDVNDHSLENKSEPNTIKKQGNGIIETMDEIDVTDIIKPSIPVESNTVVLKDIKRETTNGSGTRPSDGVQETSIMEKRSEAKTDSTSANENVDVLEFEGYGNNKKEERAIKIASSISSNVSLSIDTINSSVSKPTEPITVNSVVSKSVEQQQTPLPNTPNSVESTEPKEHFTEYNLVGSTNVAGAIPTDHLTLKGSLDIVPTTIKAERKDEYISNQEPIQTPKIRQTTETVSVDISTSADGNIASKINTAESECTTNGWSSTISTGASGGTKESLMVKLKTRVKHLETNLTLSTQYLEQMSQKYKAAMEEQKKTFEKKIISLNQSFARAESQALEFEKQSKELVKAVSSLNRELNTIKNLMQRQNEQNAENYAFLVLVQILVTMIIVWSCRSRKVNRGLHVPEQRRHSEPTMHTNENVPSLYGDNSIYGSILAEETAKEESSPSKTGFAQSIGNKRKRPKRRPRPLDHSSMDSTKPNSTRMSRTAGLLFSAGKGLFYGIAGAFTPSTVGRAQSSTTQNADALVDEFSDTFPRAMRRTRSSDLPVIQESENDILPTRPRSCDDLLITKGSVANGGHFTFIKRSGKQSG